MHGLNRCSLFVGDLAIFCTELDLERMFAPYGSITEIKIMRSEETYRNLSYGFVKFSSFESAQQAMNALDGFLLCGRPMRVRWASFKNRLDTKDMKSEGLDTSPVHVSFISYQIDRLVTEQTLRALFSRFGEVVDVSIKKSMIDKDIDRQSGYGFVHYAINPEGVDSALLAAEQLQDTTIDEVNYKSSLAHSLNRYLKDDVSMQPDIKGMHFSGQQYPHNPISMNTHPQIMILQGNIPNSQQYSQYQNVPPQFVGYNNQATYPTYTISQQQNPLYGNSLVNLNSFMTTAGGMTRYSYGNIPQEVGSLPQSSSPQSVSASLSQSVTTPMQQSMAPPVISMTPQGVVSGTHLAMSLQAPPLPLQPVLSPSINVSPVMLPNPSMPPMFSTSHSLPAATANTMYGPDLAYNISALTLSPLGYDSNGGITMISSPQMNYSSHPYGVGYFNSPIIVVPSPRSTEVRDDQLAFVNVNHLLHSPTTSSSTPYYLPGSTAILPYGTVAYPIQTAENSNGKTLNSGSSSSPHSSHGSTPSTPSSNFNSDVVMVQAAVKNEKIAAKSSIRTLTNSYRKKLNPTDELSAVAKIKDLSATSHIVQETLPPKTSDKCE